MILKKNIVTALCVISLALPVVATEQSNNEPVKKHEFGKFIGKTATSVLLGGLIGAAEGELCRRLESAIAGKEIKSLIALGKSGDAFLTALITSIICWTITTSAREGILNSIQKIMKKHNVDESFDLVKNSSRIASWLTYFHAWPFNVTMPNVLIIGQKMSNGWIKVS